MGVALCRQRTPAVALLFALAACQQVSPTLPALCPPAPDLPLVFALGGQSNMSGKGALADLPPGFPRHEARLRVFTNAWTFAAAHEPIDDPADQIDRISADVGVPDYPAVGPGLALADAVADAVDRDVILVPASMSGSRAIDWQPTPGRPRDTLYGSLLARMLQASTRGELAALLWYQGETDAQREEDARAWAERTQAMWDQLRDDLGRPELPIIYVQLPTPGPASFPFWEIVRERQAQLARPDQRLVLAPSGPYQGGDALHLATSAQLALGRALADAWVKQRHAPAE